MENKYELGEKICSEIFQKTGDIRYHNMMNGFKELNENEKQKSKEEQPAEREF